MQTVLIVGAKDAFHDELEKELQKDFCTYRCESAEEGMILLQLHHPDGLFLSLRLPGADGLYFLEKMYGSLPPVVITLSASYSCFVEQRLLDLGVAYALSSTCPVRIAARHMRYFLNNQQERSPAFAQQTVANHLHILGVPHQGGFEDLRVGTPLFAQDPGMSMTKEFYPAVAVLRGRENWQQVEKAIRTVKEAAYANRDDEVWKEYFADTSKCPRNKDFIARLAEFVS